MVRAVLVDVEARGTAYQTNTNYGKAKEPLLAFTQFLRAFAIQPLDGWKSRMSATMTGVYQFYYLENTIGQSPLRSDTVFNFFSTDFVPADTHLHRGQAQSDLQPQNGEEVLPGDPRDRGEHEHPKRMCERLHALTDVPHHPMTAVPVVHGAHRDQCIVSDPSRAQERHAKHEEGNEENCAPETHVK